MARFSTLRTIGGFIAAVIKRFSGRRFGKVSLESIYNYLKVNDRWATSGQPEADEFDLIKAAGYDCVINLAPTSVLENSLQSEAEIVTDLGMEYLHLPVDFARPSEQKFAQFVQAMNQRQTQKVWVHCAANMRVSAFTYRYHVPYLGEPPVLAQQRLHKIWHPKGVWKRFIEKASVKHKQ